MIPISDQATPTGLVPTVGNEDSTRGRVLTLVHQRGRCSVAEIAETLELTPQAIRRHVCTLTEEGWLNVSTERPCGPGVRRGRPQQVYALSEAGSRIFMHDFQTLCLDILRHVESEYGKGAVKRVMEAKMREAANSISAKWPSNYPVEQRLKDLQQHLISCGYEAEIEEEADAFYLTQSRCPYLVLAQQYQDICCIEQNILTELLGTTVEYDVRASVNSFSNSRYKIMKPTMDGSTKDVL